MSHGLALQQVFKTASSGAPNEATEGVTVTGANTYYSQPTNKARLPWSGYDLYWPTSVTSGTFTVWVSNKPNPNLANDNDWKQLALAVAINQPNGANTGDYIDLSDLPFVWVRLKYVNATGSGPILAYVSGMGA